MISVNQASLPTSITQENSTSGCSRFTVINRVSQVFSYLMQLVEKVHHAVNSLFTQAKFEKVKNCFRGWFG